MVKIKLYRLSVLLALSVCNITQSQTIDSLSFKLFSRLSFYSFETSGEFLLHVPGSMINNNLLVNIKINNETVATWNGRTTKSVLRIPLPVKLPPAEYYAFAEISVPVSHGVVYRASADLIILPYKPNEVKTDRLTGGLIVNKRQFFPFGFYCYSPVYSTLPEEEAVKGFNMISPYQKILPETISERKAYMDRCARLGMKVHYNLLSVSGGGGVGSKIEGISDEEKRERLISEIKLFKDHPALLAWYISDEPTGNKISPETLEEVYKVVRQYDPWHPVSIVFMAPFLSSRKYANAADIIMADPYPLPDLSASMVGDVAGQLRAEFTGKRAVWIVPQAFGGGELWSREPTLQEIRSMTWQAIIEGATGIQYFVRQGLNFFPKSTATWGECGRIAMEVAELTPWLLSDEKTLPVESYSGKISVTSRILNDQLAVFAVNRTNEPAAATIRISGINNAKARVLFENRTISVKGGIISDHLAPFGSQVYLINTRQDRPVTIKLGTNLLIDPGFEDLSSPGIPSACYARPGGDRGATFFLDSREHHGGNHSVRLVTPEENKSAALRFFPFQVKAGATYSISIWAKSDPEQRIAPAGEESVTNLKERETEMPQYAEISLGDFGKARFLPENKWRRFLTFITIPSDTSALFKTNLILKMPGQGVGWFDDIRVLEEVK